MLFCFSRIHGRFSSGTLLKVSGVMFTLKAVLFLAADSIPAIYCIEALQLVTYALLSPVQVYYARERVSPEDMVKGQSMATASYALGCALGNLTGGQLIGALGVTAMLAAGVAMAAAGTLILFLTLGRRDRLPEESASGPLPASGGNGKMKSASFLYHTCTILSGGFKKGSAKLWKPLRKFVEISPKSK